jgi:hypothetical protein
MPSLDDVSFDTSSLKYEGIIDDARVWSTPVGDPVSLHYFPVTPDIAAGPADPHALRRFYRAHLTAVGGVLIALDTYAVDGGRSIRQLLKVPQEPSGMTYIGSVTIPFRDFSFVLKISGREHGTTGVRDTVVCHEMIQAGVVTLDPDAGIIRGWTQDPYDPSVRDGPFPNLSEAETYDPRFPEHPLSRVRPLLRKLSATLSLGERLRDLPQFAYPLLPARRWWHVW